MYINTNGPVLCWACIITCARPRLVAGALRSSLATASSHDFPRCCDLSRLTRKELDSGNISEFYRFQGVPCIASRFVQIYFLYWKVENISYLSIMCLACWQGKSHKQKSQLYSNCYFQAYKLGGNTHIQVEVFLSAHSFQSCQNPWRICQENNHEFVPREHQIQMSKTVFF